MGSIWRIIAGMFLVVLPFIVVLGYSARSLGLRQMILIVLLVVFILGCVSGGLYLLQNVNEEEGEQDEKSIRE